MLWGIFCTTGGGGTHKLVPLLGAPGGGGKKGRGFLKGWLLFWDYFDGLISLFCT